MKYVWTYVAVACLLVVGACATYIGVPASRSLFVQEDSLVENLSAVFFALAALFSFRLFLQSKADRHMVLMVASISAVGFLDEISFGERIFNLTMPSVGDIELDAVHDLFRVALDYWAFTIPIFLLLAIGFAGRMLESFKRSGRRFGPVHALLLLCALCIGTALILDLDLVQRRLAYVVEEMLEMNAALALLFCALCIHNGQTRRSIGTRHRQVTRSSGQFAH